MTFVPQAELTTAQQQGLALIPPLKVEADSLIVKTEDQYHDADLILTRIRTAQRTWLEGTSDRKWRGINAIISPIYDGLQGLYDLKNLVLKPLEAMEGSVKDKMKGFKRLEAERIAEERRAKEREAQRLQAAIDEQNRKMAAAKSAPLKAKILGQQMELEQQQKALKKEKPIIVKAAGSAARTTKKPVVVDFGDFVSGIIALWDGENDSIPLDLLIVNPVRLAQMWKDHPEIVAALPGIEIAEEIVIAGR